MNGSAFNKLSNFKYADFAIRDEKLFYKDKKVADKAEIIFSSSEEVFFLFVVDDESVKKEFEKVVFLNFYQPQFFVLDGDVSISSHHLQFKTKDGRKNAFRMISYEGQVNTKVIGDKFLALE